MTHVTIDELYKEIAELEYVDDLNQSEQDLVYDDIERLGGLREALNYCEGYNGQTLMDDLTFEAYLLDTITDAIDPNIVGPDANFPYNSMMIDPNAITALRVDYAQVDTRLFGYMWVV